MTSAYTTFEVPPLRVVCAPSTTDVVYAGIALDAGTRHELPDESGMAHLVEHMTFKGTGRLTSLQIINRLESVGADLNAFTGKEETVYYSVFMKEHLSRALNLLLDIVFHSTYPQHELVKEVEVVCDEIESYNDSPPELIYDDFEAMLFPGHPLGRNILGDAACLRRYTSAHLQAFARRQYHPGRAVLFVMGNVSPERVRRLVEQSRAFPLSSAADEAPASGATLPPDAACKSLLPAACPEPRIISKPVHQAHVMLGATAYPFSHPDYMAQALLNNILGGPGLNSRLAMSLRERRGLVYTVESTLNAYTDVSVWSVYFGCDPSDVRRCLRLVHRELERLVGSALTPRTLAAAKRQMKGQLGISYDNFENVAIGMGKRYLHYGVVASPSELMARIDALSAADLLRVAQEVFSPQRLSTLAYMPQES